MSAWLPDEWFPEGWFGGYGGPGGFNGAPAFFPINLEDVFVEELGSPALWSAGGTINGIFQRPYEGVQIGEIEVQSFGPSFICSEFNPADSVPRAFASGQRLTIHGANYRIKTVHATGFGVVTLYLIAE